MNKDAVRSAEIDVLRIAYVEHGPIDGWPVNLVARLPLPKSIRIEESLP